MNCIKCGNELSEKEMILYKKNYIKTCTKCLNIYAREWNIKNPEKIRIRREKSSTKNNIKTREYQRKYCEHNKEKVIFHYSPKHICQWEGCTWSDSSALSVDHINNDGAEKRRELMGEENGRKGGGNRFYLWLIKNNYPNGYQILCMNHQWVKRNKYYKTMREIRDKKIREHKTI